MRGRVLRHHHRRLRQFHLHHTAQHRLLFTDETTAPVLDPGRRRVKKGQLWGYARELNAPRAQLTAPSRQARVASSRRSRSRMRLCCSPTRGRNNNGVQTANRDQSSGNEPAAPGLMSFHKVTLPSAPNLYSSVPPFALLLACRNAAFWKMDEGVESGSGPRRVRALTSCGLKPPGTAVHWVTLPSAPNLNSCPP